MRAICAVFLLMIVGCASPAAPDPHSLWVDLTNRTVELELGDPKTSNVLLLLDEGVAGVAVHSFPAAEGSFDRYGVSWNATLQVDAKQKPHELTFEVDSGSMRLAEGNGEFKFMSGEVTLHADGTHTKVKWPE